MAAPPLPGAICGSRKPTNNQPVWGFDFLKREVYNRRMGGKWRESKQHDRAADESLEGRQHLWKQDLSPEERIERNAGLTEAARVEKAAREEAADKMIEGQRERVGAARVHNEGAASTFLAWRNSQKQGSDEEVD